MRLEARAARLALRGIEAALTASAIPVERRVTTAFYFLVTIGNVPAAVVAEAAGCSRQNVSKALGKIEDRREDPAFGAEIARLEALFMGEA